MDDLGFPFVAILLPLTIVLELGSGLAVAIGRLGARTAAIMLAAHTLAITKILHNFWSMTGDLAQTTVFVFQ